MLSIDKEDIYIYIYIYKIQITILGMETMTAQEMKSAPEGLIPAQTPQKKRLVSLKNSGENHPRENTGRQKKPKNKQLRSEQCRNFNQFNLRAAASTTERGQETDKK